MTKTSNKVVFTVEKETLFIVHPNYIQSQTESEHQTKISLNTLFSTGEQ